MKKKSTNNDRPPEQLLLNEIQLLLAEKRTYYSVLRTGIAIATMPLTIIGFLLATIKYHHLFDTFWVGYSVISALVLVSIGGLFIVQNASHKLRRLNDFITLIKQENKRLAEIII